MDEDGNEKKYLANKHRGGESGRRGNLYEAYYAVFAIFFYLCTRNQVYTYWLTGVKVN